MENTSRKNGIGWQLLVPIGSLILSIAIATAGLGFWLGGFNSSLERFADVAVQKAMDDLLGPGAIIPRLSLGQSGAPPGWVVCGQDGTPDFRGRFLIGTTDINDAGKPVGTPGPGWQAGTTGGESGGRLAPERDGNADFADNITSEDQGVHGDRNWYHEHSLPSVQVIFLCRVQLGR